MAKMLIPLLKKTSNNINIKTKIMTKAFLSLAVGLLMTVTLMAQVNKRTTAYNYMNEGKLDRALENIEPCITNEKTMVDDKTWRYRGQIYSLIANSTDENYKKLHPFPLKEAINSYAKAMEFDPKGVYKKEDLYNLGILQQQANYYGGVRYGEENFKSSYNHFKLGAEAAARLGAIDTVAMYNAGLSAERAKMYTEAAAQYQECIQHQYMGAKMYIYLANLYEKSGEADKYMTTVQAGRQAYPADGDLIRAELNYYLVNNKYVEAENNLKLAIQNDPNDKALHFALGVVYDNLKRYDEAAPAYLKAINIDANYFDALYNLGALYFNQGVELNNAANDADDKTYAKLRDQAKAKFVEAEPFLDRAKALQPEDCNTLISLRQLYAFTNQTDKWNKVKAEIEQFCSHLQAK
jgi:tetratricopeptide (TPR) repeat protein